MNPETGFRDAFDLNAEAVYLNAASEGPVPRRVGEAIQAILERKSHPFRLGGEEYFQLPQRSREFCARIVGAQPQEVVLTGATGFGINLALNSLPLSEGDEVLYLKDDFPSLVNPILHARNRGLVPVAVEPADRFPALRDFERSATSRTRLLALSHVLPSHGFRHDLASLGRFCRERGVLFVVDAAQSAGVLPIRFAEHPIDLLAAPAHKWLLGFPGAGFTVIRSELMERMTPPAVGWMGSLSHASQFIAPPPFDLALFKGGRKFEIGTTPYLNLAAWNVSLELILEVGIETISRHVQDLLEPLRAYLRESKYKVVSSEDPAHHSAILAFTGKYPAKLFRLLNQRKIFPGLRRGAIRIAPHLYNTAGDMHRLIGILRELEGAGVEADRKGEKL